MDASISSLAEYFTPSSVLAVSVPTLLIYFIYQYGTRRKFHFPPGPVGLPLFGNIFSLIFTSKQQYEVLNEWSRKYGEVFSIKLLNVRVYILNNAEMLRELFSSLKTVDRKPVSVVQDLTGRENTGIAFSSQDVWKEQRRFFLTVFRKNDEGGTRIEGIVGEQFERMLVELDKTNGLSFDPQSIIGTSIGNIILKVMTGATYEFGDEEFSRVTKHSYRIFDLLGPAGILSAVPLLAAIPTTSKRELTREWGALFDFIKERIANHKTELSLQQEASNFIDYYLQEMALRTAENRGSFDETNLMVSCTDVLLGGWETTTTSIAWALHTLASYPEVQHRVHQEINDVIGQGRLPRFGDYHQLPITMATITECMRFQPAFDVQIPHLATQDCRVGKYDIPKGSLVTSNLNYALQDPSTWKDPQEFQPNRFLHDSGEYDRKREPLFFGTGRRVCPGEQLARTEIFLFLTYILQRYTLRLSEDTRKDLGSRHGLTNQPDLYRIHAVKIDA